MSVRLVRHIPDTKCSFYPFWRRYLGSRNLLKRAVRSFISDPEPLTVQFLRRRGLHVKMILDSPQCRYIVHLLAAEPYGKHIDLVHRAAMHGGVPSQQIIDATDSFLSRLRSGLRVVILDYIPGTINHELFSVDECRSLGRTLAQLHNVQAPFWGSPALQLQAMNSRSQILAEWISLQHAISKLPNFPWLIDEAKMITWQGDRLVFLDNIKSFSLIHGDPHQNNVVFTPDGRANLIDLDTAEYSIGVVELARVLVMSQCGLETTRQHALIEGYLEHAKQELRDFWIEHSAMATVAAMLIMVADFVQSAEEEQALGLDRMAEASLEIAVFFWLWRQHIVASDPHAGIDWWSLTDCMPRLGRLASGLAERMMERSRELRTARKDPTINHHRGISIAEDGLWVM